MTIIKDLRSLNTNIVRIMQFSNKCNNCYGFDLEFTTIGNNPIISTIQIAYNNIPSDVLIIFFELDELGRCKFKEELISKSNYLFKFLVSKKHIKVGVNITDDIMKIYNEFSITTYGYIDIQSIALSLRVRDLSMDRLGSVLIPDYIAKKKPKGGYRVLNDNNIRYITDDAINSLKIYYAIIGFNKEQLEKIINNRMLIEVDEESITFAKSFFESINQIRFSGFASHMHSCYSIWCKTLTKSEAINLSEILVEKLLERKIIQYQKGFLKLAKVESEEYQKEDHQSNS